MVGVKSVEKQLKRIRFNANIWGRGEANELPNILLPDEKIAECVNGIYEAGFALLCATDMRLLLIDKKPLNYLTVEDLRFDMINELDYSHRLLGAQISISAGSKNLKFRSFNQPRLRKLISHVQHRMVEIKQQQSNQAENQKQHLENINKQLQMYLLAQQQQIQQQLQSRATGSTTGMPQPSPELSDYLFSQRLLEQLQVPQQSSASSQANSQPSANQANPPGKPAGSEDMTQEMLDEGKREVFGPAYAAASQTPVQSTQPAPTAADATTAGQPKSLEVNALRIAYSKLPMMMRNRRFGRPSFHAHSQANTAPGQTQPAPTS